jgi:hypothetical protein
MHANAYRDDGHGRAASDPSMMVALVHAYAVGVRSSRAIAAPRVSELLQAGRKE